MPGFAECRPDYDGTPPVVVMMRGGHVNPWLLRGWLVCDVCGRVMTPALNTAADLRVYSCGPVCPQVDLPATDVEQDMLLGALVRAVTTLHRDLARAAPEPGGMVWRTGERPPVDADALARWQQCELTERTTVLAAAYVSIRVTAAGKVRPVWQRNASADIARALSGGGDA